MGNILLRVVVCVWFNNKTSNKNFVYFYGRISTQPSEYDGVDSCEDVEHTFTFLLWSSMALCFINFLVSIATCVLVGQYQTSQPVSIRPPPPPIYPPFHPLTFTFLLWSSMALCFINFLVSIATCVLVGQYQTSQPVSIRPPPPLQSTVLFTPSLSLSFSGHPWLCASSTSWSALLPVS